MAADDHRLKTSTGLRVKYTFIVVNFVFFLACFAILGVGIWIALESNLVSVVFEIVGQQNKMKAPVYLVTIGAAVVAPLAFAGGYAAYKEVKSVIMAYIIAALCIFILVLVGAILALVYRSQVDERVRTTMRETLVKSYGTDTFITNTWDFAQVSLYCCAVEDASWGVYRSSQWFYNQPGELEERVQVPESCCEQDQYGAVFDHEQCQLYRSGPPRRQHGPRNKALRYRGCFTVAQERTHQYAMAIAVTGFMLSICMVLGTIVASILLTLMNRSRNT